MYKTEIEKTWNPGSNAKTDDNEKRKKCGVGMVDVEKSRRHAVAPTCMRICICKRRKRELIDEVDRNGGDEEETMNRMVEICREDGGNG